MAFEIKSLRRQMVWSYFQVGFSKSDLNNELWQCPEAVSLCELQLQAHFL